MDSLSTIDLIGGIVGILSLILTPTVLITLAVLKYKRNKRSESKV